VDVQLPPGCGERFQRVVFDDVAPERYEGGSAVIDDENSILGQKAIDQNVQAGRINPAVAYERQMFGAQLGVLRKRLVDRIAVDAVKLLAVMPKILGEDASL
jgi:hypothetical protein